MDVDNACLQGTLYEEIFIAQPHGFVDSNFLSHVCRLLRKPIYGLKKSLQACIKNSTLFGYVWFMKKLRKNARERKYKGKV